MDIGYETVSICPQCAQGSPSHYEANPEGVFLVGECPEHGEFREHAEKDLDFFRWGYEQEYSRSRNHLVLPVTYRCNLACKYCYTLSNTELAVPDRTFDEVMKIISAHKGSLNFIGGEPTVREDLPEIIAAAAAMPNIGRVSICTNGQRLKDARYLRKLKEAGLNFVFLSINDVEYDLAATVQENRLQALDNCRKLRVPVLLQATISNLHQLDSFISVLREYSKIIFRVYLRPVRPYGINHPNKQIFVSDILEYLGKRDDYEKGYSPFCRSITLEGKPATVGIFVGDVNRTDPIDWNYVISDDRVMKLYRGFRTDEVLLRRRLFGDETLFPSSERVKAVLKKSAH